MIASIHSFPVSTCDLMIYKNEKIDKPQLLVASGSIDNSIAIHRVDTTLYTWMNYYFLAIVFALLAIIFAIYFKNKV